MTDEGVSLVFEWGDVVYGDDPFKGEEDARPWLTLLNHKDVRSTASNTSR
nr:hypothetical protein [Haloterrigena sp. H1]